jgi:alpha-mannosidase
MKEIRLPLKRSLEANARATERLHERFAAQLAFGRWLCEKYPGKSEGWTSLLDHAEAALKPIFESGSTTEMETAIAESEAGFSVMNEAAKDHTIYCVGHAHIDMNWMWSWPETVAATNDTFTSVLRLMDEFPSFIFSQSQASVYRIVEKFNPSMLDEIAARIREGRWEVTASHWVETEKNIVSGESLCRHILYTRKYLQEIFDLEPEDVRIDWSPDTFGHASTVPTYLAEAGVEYLYLHRPGAHGVQPRPRAFWWQGPNGARVLTWNDMAFGYNGRIEPEVLLRSLTKTYDETALPFSLFVYGVGDHGGGPTRRDLVSAIDMNAWPLFPRVTFSTADSFYRQLESRSADLPVLDYELNFEFTGCYTTQSLIKKANRYSEKKLIGAEIASVTAGAAAGTPYPFEIYEEGWRNTLFNHFHDIIPGSGVRDTRTYSHGLYQETVAGTGSSTAIALRALAGQVNTATAADSSLRTEHRSISAGVGRGSIDGGMSEYEFSSVDGTRCVLLFNPLPYSREEIVETTIWEGYEPWTDQQAVEFTVTAPDGTVSGAQVLERGGYWGHRFIRIAYPAQIPGIGYTVQVVRETDDDSAQGETAQIGLSHECNYALYERGPEGLENSLVRMDLDPSSGGIKRFTVKEAGLDLIGTGGPVRPVLRYLLERARPMSAWEIEHGGSELDPELRKLERLQDGPLTAGIRAEYRIADSTVVLTYKLKQNDPNLYLDFEIEWNERGGEEIGTPSIRLAIPANLNDLQTDYEIPFGAVTRTMEHGEEVPALRWAAITGTTGEQKAGLLLMNDSKHGHSCIGGTLYLSLIRSSFAPDTHPEVGQHEIHCALRPFAGDLAVPKAIEWARVFDHPVESVATDIHEGRLELQATVIDWKSETLVLDAVKMAEDKNGIICRIHNPEERIGKATLTPDRNIFGMATAAAETDLMERAAASPGTSVADGRVTLSVPARGIRTLRITFA